MNIIFLPISCLCFFAQYRQDPYIAQHRTHTIIKFECIMNVEFFPTFTFMYPGQAFQSKFKGDV